MPTKTKAHCVQCDMTEDHCDCEKYCVLCQSQMDIRLCTDGLYYCLACREACEYKVSD
jgi:sulfur transfer complex TusBCD TusB component (DsrH family)